MFFVHNLNSLVKLYFEVYLFDINWILSQRQSILNKFLKLFNIYVNEKCLNATEVPREKQIS